MARVLTVTLNPALDLAGHLRIFLKQPVKKRACDADDFDVLRSDSCIFALYHGHQCELGEHHAWPDTRLEMRLAIPSDHVELDFAARDDVGAFRRCFLAKQGLASSNLSMLSAKRDQSQLIGVEAGKKRQFRQELDIVAE